MELHVERETPMEAISRAIKTLRLSNPILRSKSFKWRMKRAFGQTALSNITWLRPLWMFLRETTEVGKSSPGEGSCGPKTDYAIASYIQNIRDLSSKL